MVINRKMLYNNTFPPRSGSKHVTNAGKRVNSELTEHTGMSGKSYSKPRVKQCDSERSCWKLLELFMESIRMKNFKIKSKDYEQKLNENKGIFEF